MGSKFSSKHTILDDPDFFEGGYVITGEILYDVEEETKKILSTFNLTGCTPDELVRSARRKAHLDNETEIFYDEEEYLKEYEGYLLTDQEIDDMEEDDDDDDPYDNDWD